MAKQHGGVVKLPSGRYMVRMSIGGKRKAVCFDSYSDAMQATRRLQDERRGQKLGIQVGRAPARPTVGRIFDDYLDELRVRRCSAAQIKDVTASKRFFEMWCGLGRDAAFDRIVLRGFVDWMFTRTKTNGRWVRKSLGHLGTAMRLAMLPVPKMPKVEIPERVQKTIDLDAFRNFLATLPEGSPEKVFAEISIRTGLRESEVRKLRIGDLGTGYLVVTHGKGKEGSRGSQEKVPLDRSLESLIRASLPMPASDDDPLIGIESARGGLRRRYPLAQASLRKRILAACRRAGIPERGGLGWLRHEAATLALENGEALLTVSRALGHEGTKVTADHYDESTRAAAEKWNAREALASRMSQLLSNSLAVTGSLSEKTANFSGQNRESSEAKSLELNELT